MIAELPLAHGPRAKTRGLFSSGSGNGSGLNCDRANRDGRASALRLPVWRNADELGRRYCYFLSLICQHLSQKNLVPATLGTRSKPARNRPRDP